MQTLQNKIGTAKVWARVLIVMEIMTGTYGCEQRPETPNGGSDVAESDEASISLTAGSSNPTNDFVARWYSTRAADQNVPQAWVNENRVFTASMWRAAAGEEWNMEIGRGGQIISLSKPNAIFETIGRQRSWAGQWVDDAYFPTIPNTAGLCTGVDTDIHMAGYYNGTFSDGSHYTDVAVKKESGTVVRYDAWPVHAHNAESPTTCTHQMNNLIIHNKFTDKGKGVIEVRLEFDRYAAWTPTAYSTANYSAKYNKVHMSKISVRQSEHNNVYNLDPSTKALTALNHSTLDGVHPMYTSYQGAFAVGDNTSGPGVGWIYGSNGCGADGVCGKGNDDDVLQINDALPADPQHHMHALIARSVPAGGIDPNETYVVVYYLYVGDLSNFSSIAATYGSRAKATFPTPRKASQVGLVPIYSDGGADSRFWRGDDLNKPTSASSLQFWLYERFMPGAMPVFLIQNASNNTYRITHDPYIFGTNVVSNPTKLTYFLGWAISGIDATTAAGTCNAQVQTINGTNIPGSINVDNSYYQLNDGFKFVNSNCATDTAGVDL